MSQPSLPSSDLDLVCDLTAGMWEDLRHQRIFITGGTGFFGRWLLESFLAANDRFQLAAQAMVLTRSTESFRAACPLLANHPSIHLLHGDVLSFPFPQEDYPFVIHAAADVSAARGRAEASSTNLQTTLIEGTRRVLDFAAAHKTIRFLMVSSGAVYGTQPPSLTHLPEEYAGAGVDHPHQPGSAYGTGKRASELLCSTYSGRGGLACAIARPFAFVGPHLPLDQGFAIGDFIRSALAREPITITSDGAALRSYLYAADLAVWLWTILFRADPLRPYNVGSGIPISVRALANEVASILSPGFPVHVALPANPLGPVQQYVPDVARSAQELGLAQTVSLQDAIRRTAAWHGWRPETRASRQEQSH